MSKKKVQTETPITNLPESAHQVRLRSIYNELVSLTPEHLFPLDDIVMAYVSRDFHNARLQILSAIVQKLEVAENDILR